MNNSKRIETWPGSRYLQNIPEVDDVRPKRCDRCGHPARKGSRVVLHGHGCRTRQIVVQPVAQKRRARLLECWERRYRCTKCKRVMVALPKGVIPRYLYSVAAIVMAFLLVAERPIGQGLTDGEAYRRQGMYAQLCSYAESPYRWRSLGRWARCAQKWWPSWCGSLPSLLIGFRQHTSSGDIEDVIGIAVASHSLGL